MSDILDVSGHKIATIGENGKVHNTANVVMGHVAADGQVYNNVNALVGNFGAQGFVYKQGNHIGTVHPDGGVYDYENHLVGKVVGDHIESGGAALLLLIR